MATSSSPPTMRKAGAAAAGGGAPAPAAICLGSCCWYLFICVIFAAGLFYCCCCAPLAMAVEAIPEPISDITSFWGTDEMEEHYEHMAPKLDKKEWRFIDSRYPEASSELSVVKLPLPSVIDGKLFVQRRTYEDAHDISMLHDFFAYGPMRNGYQRNTNHLEIMAEFMKYLRKQLNEKEEVPLTKSFEEEARSLLARDDWQCTMAAQANNENIASAGLATTIQRDSDRKADVRLSLRKPIPISDAVKDGTKVLFWEYSASFIRVCNKLTPIKDSLTVEEKGDSDVYGNIGEWIINHKIDRSFSYKDWKISTSHYYWNLKCSNKFNYTQPEYEYTWNTDFVGFDITKESFVGKTYLDQDDKAMTALDKSMAKPKCLCLLLTRDKGTLSSENTRDLIEKVAEMPDGRKIHAYYMRKTYHEMDLMTSWTGIAISDVGQDVSISLDEIPLTYYQHSGMFKSTARVSNCVGMSYELYLTDAMHQWKLVPQYCTRYASSKTRPNKWFTALCDIDKSKKFDTNFFSYTSEDLRQIATSSKPETTYPYELGLGHLKKVFTCPVESGRTISPKQENERSQISCNPYNNFDWKSKLTNRKHIVLNGISLFCITLTFFIFMELVKWSQKHRKEHRGI